jgi:hypothetical protein
MQSYVCEVNISDCLCASVVYWSELPSTDEEV